MKRVAWIGIVLGICYWIIESMMDTFVYDLGPFNERLLTPDLNELMMRSLAVALLAAFGFYAQSMMNKLEKSDQRLARMNQCFLSFGPDPVENINSLTKLCGELLGASSSFYNRLDQGLMCSWGQWQTPAGFSCEGSPEGRICYDVINRGSEGVIVVNNLQETVYALTDPSVVGCGLKTYIGHAVRLGQDVVGSLCTFYHDEYIPREEDKRLLGIIASAVGVEEVRGKARNALRESERQMRKLSARLISAQEIERKRIARQLHDSIGQSLSAIKYSIEDTLEKASQQNGSAQELKGLEAAVPLIKQVVDEVRRMQKNLRPSMLDDLGIVATISWFCREFQAIYSDSAIEKEVDIKESQVPEILKTTIYRILQEAMNNVAKHSKASLVHLSLKGTDTGLELTIEDNGHGFEFQGALSSKTGDGLGLSSMKERTELSGGTFSIRSIPGTGVTVKASWQWDEIRASD